MLTGPLVEHKNETETRVYFNKLVEKEKLKNYHGLFSPIVLLELMSHLADENDKYFNICKKAIIGAYIHCKEDNGNFKMLMDMDVHLCKLLFDKELQDSIKDQLRFGKIAYAIYSNIENYIRTNVEAFKDVKNFIENEEKVFIDNINKYVIGPIKENLNTSKKSFKEEFDNFVSSGRLKEFISLSQLLKACNILNIVPNEIAVDKQRKLLDYIIKKFGTPINLYQNLIVNIVDSNGHLKIEKKKRPNLIWDFQICFCVGRNEIGGEPVMLVSDDKAILKASSDAGFSESIMKLEDYLNVIE